MNNYTSDELLNIVELLKQALSFYSNENNYLNENVIRDDGNLGRTILSQVDELFNMKQNFQIELDDYLNDENNDINNIKSLVEFINKHK